MINAPTNHATHTHPQPIRLSRLHFTSKAQSKITNDEQELIPTVK